MENALTENFTAIWETLNQCEQLSYIHQIGKLMSNTFSLNSTESEGLTMLLWGVFMKMIDKGCWV